MKDMTPFQWLVVGVCGVFIIVGVVVFALGGRGGDSKEYGNVIVWGTVDRQIFEEFMRLSKISDDDSVSVSYTQKRADTFDNEFIEALASQTGPDLFMLSETSIVKHRDKIVVIPFESFSERKFKESFIEEGELFLTGAGALALPFTIDPMVTYWNRDIFGNAGLSSPPKNWSELYDLSHKLTRKDNNLNILQSAVALGEYSNVTNAFEIVSLLTMQAGNPIIQRRPDGSLNNLLSSTLSFPVAPTNRAVSFYTDFSNPLKTYYSWNRSLPSSKNFFLSGNLALYFGFASEARDIAGKNPNLNFDVAPILQSKDAPRFVTYGRMSGLAIPKNSKNIIGAFKVATMMTEPAASVALSSVTGLPPVRRDALQSRPADNLSAIFYDAAVQSRAWLSPEASRVGPVFREMIESVTGGRAMPSDAISRASSQLDALLR